MSKIDDLIFEPIMSALSWRDQCRIIVEYIEKKGESLRPMKQVLSLSRPRPFGSLLLEELMELYHDKGQRVFYCVVIDSKNRIVSSLIFNGTLIFGKYEEGNAPMLGGFNGRRSIRDLNLVPNTYTRHYVFTSETDACAYCLA